MFKMLWDQCRNIVDTDNVLFAAQDSSDPFEMPFSFQVLFLFCVKKGFEGPGEVWWGLAVFGRIWWGLTIFGAVW